MNDGVFIAMPVYRGVEFIEETMRSVLAQTYRDFHLVMSVDGSDDPSIEICQKYANDPRIDVVVQESRLGWPGNFNWLIERCDREFFCYWQQDDLASTGYLENLRKELLARPDASICYTDVQWFGARFDRNGSPSIEGDPLSRVMQHIEAIRYEPLRGLMRASMFLGDREAIPVTEDESCQEEFVFLSDMAAAGTFIRVDSAMYFKRSHDDNVFARWARFPEWRRRRGWISMGAGMYEVARGLAPAELSPRVLGHILDRLAIERPGRAYLYRPAQAGQEIGRFVRDFVAHSQVPAHELTTEEWERHPLERPIHSSIRMALQAEHQDASHRKRLEGEQSRQRIFDFDKAQNHALLGYGWSYHESWGVWNDGREASLRLPVPPMSKWKAIIEGRTYSSRRVARIGFGVDGSDLQYDEFPSQNSVVITLDSKGHGGNQVRFDFPDATAPLVVGDSLDGRTLGFGLTRVTVLNSADTDCRDSAT